MKNGNRRKKLNEIGKRVNEDEFEEAEDEEKLRKTE